MPNKVPLPPPLLPPRAPAMHVRAAQAKLPEKPDAVLLRTLAVPRPVASHVQNALARTVQAKASSTGATGALRPAGSKIAIQLAAASTAAAPSATSAAATTTTPHFEILLKEYCHQTFWKHVATSEEGAKNQAKSIMSSGSGKREICTTFVLSEAEALAFGKEILQWRTAKKAAGDYWATCKFSKAVEATLLGMSLWTGTIEARIGFDGSKANHLADCRGGSATALGGTHKKF